MSSQPSCSSHPGIYKPCNFTIKRTFWKIKNPRNDLTFDSGFYFTLREVSGRRGLVSDNADGTEAAALARIQRGHRLVANSERLCDLDQRRLHACIDWNREHLVVDFELSNIFCFDFSRHFSGALRVHQLQLHSFHMLLLHFASGLCDAEAFNQTAVSAGLVIVRRNQNAEHVVLQAFPFVSDHRPTMTVIPAVGCVAGDFLA